MAMKLLEKDIHEKQDTIVSLRRQLDDIKQINLEMYRKLQVSFRDELFKGQNLGCVKQYHMNEVGVAGSKLSGCGVIKKFSFFNFR